MATGSQQSGHHTPPGFKINPGFEKVFWQTIIRSLPAKIKGQLRGIDRGQWPVKIVRLSAKDMRSLWQVFTSQRGDISRYLHEPKRELLAYRLGFHLANCARLQAGFNRALPEGWQGWVGKDDKVRIIDLGCGAGSFSHTVFHALTKPSAAGHNLNPENITIELIDQKRAFVDGAKDGLVDLGCPSENILTLKQGLRPWLSQFAGKVLAKDEKLIVGMTYVYNEIRHDHGLDRKLMEWFQALAQKDSLAVVLEPGNQGLCQQAMDLRDDMVMQGFSPLYPCPSASLCPMRQQEQQRDWCYSEFRWQRSVPMTNVDQILETDRKNLAGTLMIMAGQAYSGKKSDRSHIVTGRPVDRSASPKKVPGSYQYLICTGEKLAKTEPKPQRKVLLRGETLSEGNS